MEDRLRRITSLASELVELYEIRRSTFARSSQVISTTDEIITRMEFLKETVRLEASSIRKHNSQNTSILEKRKNFSLNLSNASASTSSGTVITHATINGTHVDAATLYDMENYSKCVRFIEKVAPRNTDRELLLLCHGSYRHMLADSLDNREAAKLCEWWRAYIEKLECEEACQKFRMEILECLAECLWETTRLTSCNRSVRESVMSDLMNTKIEIHQLTRIDYRPFHVKFLRRLEHICFVLADYFSSAEENKRIPRYVHTGITVVIEALSESREDEKKYRTETGNQESDPNLALCSKLVRELELLMNHIETEELNRDRNMESTGTSGLGTPLSSPEHGADLFKNSAQIHEDFNLTAPFSNRITTYAEIHEQNHRKELNNNKMANNTYSEYDDDESFILHL